MHVFVTCECCGHRQQVARVIRRPEAFHVICHGCEQVLQVVVTQLDISEVRSPGKRLVP